MNRFRVVIFLLFLAGCSGTRNTLVPVAGPGTETLKISILDAKSGNNSFLTRLARDPFHLGMPFGGSEELAQRSWNMSVDMPQAQDCRGRYQVVPKEVSLQRLLLQDFTEAELDAALDDSWRDIERGWRAWRGMVTCADRASIYVFFYERSRWFLMNHINGIAKDRSGTVYRLDFLR